MEQNRSLYVLKKIWPTIYRIINSVFYFILTLIKGVITYAMRQIKEL